MTPGATTGKGIRGHEGRWDGDNPRRSPACHFGGFLAAFQTPRRLTTSIRVLNNVLNHAARIRVDTTSRLGPVVSTTMKEPAEESGNNAEVNEVFVGHSRSNLTGESCKYVGETARSWAWYRGTSRRPIPVQ